MVDKLVAGGLVVAMDGARRVIEGGAVAIAGDRIAAVGEARELRREHPDAELIDAAGMAVLPGLVDAHAHAGHGLVKSLGGGDGHAWNEACARIYTVGSSPEFWAVEARLSALERIRCGTTTGVSYLGGGDDVMRVDEPIYGDLHVDAVEEAGTRSLVAVGINRPPFPVRYRRWGADGGAQDLDVAFADQLATCEELIRRRHRGGSGRASFCLSFPVHHPAELDYDDSTLALVRDQATATRALARSLGVVFTQDGHRNGSIKVAHEQFALLGPDVLLSHCVNMTAEEIAICRETDAKIAHNPSSNLSVRGRCPVPELIEAGVTVAIGSDGTAPDRSFDMFRHMWQCMHYHRRHFRDPGVLPPGKMLEMVTIDGARALGMDSEIGSLEPGKKADLILVDLRKPHLYPPNMPLYRLAYFATGADVDTTIVDGKVLMRGRRVLTLDEDAVLDAAAREAALAIDRAGVAPMLDTPEGFWGRARF